MGHQPRATTTEEAFRVLDPFALVKPGDPFFADIEADLPAEHYGVSTELKRHFRAVQTGFDWQHIALVGHAGTGKTTLVRKAMSELAATGVMEVQINTTLVFDRASINFADMMLVIARAVIQCLEAQEIELEGTLIDQAQRWFADELLEESQSKQISGAIEASGGAENKLALLAAFSAKVTAALKSDNDYRRTIRLRAERDPQDLLRRVNILLDGAHVALAARSQRICVVFDNLEKISNRELVDEAVLRRADEFRMLRCHLLLFLNPADQYSPHTIQASQAFPLITVPVLPVRFRGDPPDKVREDAHRAITRLLDARMMLGNIFEDIGACVDSLAQLSGGHVRDLLSLARRASELAEPGKITVAHIQKAARRLAAERTVLMRPEDWSRAAQLATTNRVDNRDEDSHLILHSCVLNYDGEPWWDVHPFLRTDPRFSDADA